MCHCQYSCTNGWDTTLFCSLGSVHFSGYLNGQGCNLSPLSEQEEVDHKAWIATEATQLRLIPPWIFAVRHKKGGLFQPRLLGSCICCSIRASKRHQLAEVQLSATEVT